MGDGRGASSLDGDGVDGVDVVDDVGAVDRGV
jgi:hypothetical protein